MGQDILLVDQFFYPDSSAIAQLLTELATGLQNKGWQVRVVTSKDEYVTVERPAMLNPELLGVQIWRAPRILRGPARRFKLLRQLWFCLVATAKLLMEPPPALFIVQTTPPMVTPCVAMVARLRRRPYMIIAQDLYPEMLAADGVLNETSPVYRALRSLIDCAFREADAVVSLGSTMTNRLLHKGVRRQAITEISNWAIGDLKPWVGESSLRARWGLADAFVIQYSGNLGRGHEFHTFLEGAKLAKRSLPRLKVLIVGSGGRLEEVKHWVATNQAKEWVHFKPYQPQDVLRESLGVADLALITMQPGWEGLLVPSKLLGILAMGQPILYVGPESEISNVIYRHSIGFHVPNGDIHGVAQAILRAANSTAERIEMGNRARQVYITHFSRESMLDKYDDLIRSLIHRIPRAKGK